MAGFDEVTQMLCESAESFLAARDDRLAQQRSPGQPLAICRETWRAMAELGWQGLSLPEAMGGSGMGTEVAASLCETLGRHNFAQPYIPSALMPAAIFAAAEADTGMDLAAALASGSRVFCLGWQERADASALPTPAAIVENGRLQGKKVFVTGLEDDSVLLVYAVQAGRPVVVAVDADAGGISIARTATAQGSYCEVLFDHAPLRLQQPLLAGKLATDAVQYAIAQARVAASAQLAGIARGCLDKTIDYVNQRVQFGRPIATFQSVKHRCVDLRIGIALADASWREAAARLDADLCDGRYASSPVATAAVCAAKARCSDMARLVGKEAVQLHGAMGFTEECDIGLYLRAAMQYSSWLGGPVTMRREFMAVRAVESATAGAAHG